MCEETKIGKYSDRLRNKDNWKRKEKINKRNNRKDKKGKNVLLSFHDFYLLGEVVLSNVSLKQFSSSKAASPAKTKGNCSTNQASCAKRTFTFEPCFSQLFLARVDERDRLTRLNKLLVRADQALLQSRTRWFLSSQPVSFSDWCMQPQVHPGHQQGSKLGRGLVEMCNTTTSG